jgi:hypothetical protein
MSELEKQEQRKGSCKFALISFVVMLLAFFIFIFWHARSENLRIEGIRADNAEQVQQLFGGSYPLRKLYSEKTENETWQADGRYFIVAGKFSASGETKTERDILLSWQLYNGKCTFSRVSFEKVYVKIDNDVEDPYIIFEIDEKEITLIKEDYEWYKVNELLETELIPAITVVCKEDHWERKIEDF